MQDIYTERRDNRGYHRTTTVENRKRELKGKEYANGT